MTDTTREHAIWCSICELKHSENTASVFCAECDQAFCSDCDVHHKLSKPLKDHVTVPIEQFRLLPPFITKVETFCNEHGKPFELYCPDHKEPICVMCLVVTHRCCASILPFQQVIRNVTKADILDEYTRTVGSLFRYIENVREERLSSLSKFKDDMDKVKEKIASLRKDMNDYLDEIECKIATSLNKSYKNYAERSDNMFSTLSENEKILQTLTVDIKKTRDNATLLQTYLASTYIENLISEKESLLQDLLSSNFLQDIDIETLASVDIKTKVKIMNFPEVVGVNDVQSRIDYIDEKTKHAQLSVITPKSIEHIQLVPETEINFNSDRVDCNIVGCAIRESGEYVFCDYSENRRLLIFNGNGEFDRLIKTSERPCCVAFLDKDRIALTFGDTCIVQIRRFLNGQVMTKVELDEKCVGVQCINGFLFVRCINYIHKLDQYGQIIFSSEIKHFDSPHLHFHGKNIVTVGYDGICWLNLDGTFTRQHWMGYSDMVEGITVDKFGNVYASIYNENEVIVIAQNGSRHKIILDKEDGLVLPTGLCYNFHNDKLLIVTSSLHRAVVYKINQ